MSVALGIFLESRALKSPQQNTRGVTWVVFLAPALNVSRFPRGLWFTECLLCWCIEEEHHSLPLVCLFSVLLSAHWSFQSRLHETLKNYAAGWKRRLCRTLLFNDNLVFSLSEIVIKNVEPVTTLCCVRCCWLYTVTPFIRPNQD